MVKNLQNITGFESCLYLVILLCMSEIFCLCHVERRPFRAKQLPVASVDDPVCPATVEKVKIYQSDIY